MDTQYATILFFRFLARQNSSNAHVRTEQHRVGVKMLRTFAEQSSTTPRTIKCSADRLNIFDCFQN